MSRCGEDGRESEGEGGELRGRFLFEEESAPTTVIHNSGGGRKREQEKFEDAENILEDQKPEKWTTEKVEEEEERGSIKHKELRHSPLFFIPLTLHFERHEQQRRNILRAPGEARQGLPQVQQRSCR